MHLPSGTPGYASILGGWESPDLFEAADAVRALQRHPGWEILSRLVTEKKVRDMDTLLGQGVMDQAHYAAIQGFLQGEKQAFTAADAVLKAAKDRQAHEERELRKQERERELSHA